MKKILRQICTIMCIVLMLSSFAACSTTKESDDRKDIVTNTVSSTVEDNAVEGNATENAEAEEDAENVNTGSTVGSMSQQETGVKTEKLPTLSETIMVGDIVEFGQYYSVYDSEKELEPIQWRVLDKQGDKALLISHYVIEKDCFFQYEDRHNNITWENCSLRQWLNNEFVDIAFNEKERAILQDTQLSTPANPESGISGGNDTTDKLFVFSIEEVNQYLGAEEERSARVTNHVSVSDYEGRGTWWLRNPGLYQNKFHSIGTSGQLLGGVLGSKSDDIGVRPAAWIDLSGSNQVVKKVEKTITNAPVTYVELKNAEVGNYVQMGVYEQDNNLENGAEPISWKVLDKQENCLLLLTEYVLDCKPYDSKSRGLVAWQESNIREWLQGEFMTATLTEVERGWTLDNAADTMFFLSEKQVKQYLEDREEVRARATVYAIENGASGDEWYGNYSMWWMGSHNSTYKNPHIATFKGNVDNDVEDAENVGVRPAIWIDLNKVK